MEVPQKEGSTDGLQEFDADKVHVARFLLPPDLGLDRCHARRNEAR